MGRKPDQKKNSKKSHKHQQQQEQEEDSVDQQQHDQGQQQQDDDQDIDIDDLVDGEIGNIDGDAIILDKIQTKIQQCDNEQKLTWAAIYQIKKQQADLNEQMQIQIDAIKQKYQTLRFPLSNKVSDAVSGKKLQKSYYSENQFTKSINLNKINPKPVKDYWGKVFEACGLIGSQVDIELLETLRSFKCELIDVKIQHMKLIFQFQDNDCFDNKLQIQVSGSVVEGTFKKIINFKTKGSVPDQNSLFGLLTASDSDDQEVFDTCIDLFRAYGSSTYFYFYEPKEEQQGEDEGEQGQQQNNNKQGQKGQQEDQQSDQQDIRPVKKTKASAISQKPQCKQQ